MSRCLHALARGYDALLELLAPTKCVGCEARLPPRVPLCAECREALVSPAVCSVDGIVVVARTIYQPPLRDAIRRLKYDNRPDLARPLAQLVAESLEDFRDTGALLVPVPVHPHRLAERGYNQAALLAGALACWGPWKSAPLALARRRWSGPQVGHDRTARLQNVKNDFAVRQAKLVAARTVIVVDDVVTTGATAYSCLSALRSAGAKVVAVAAIARAGGKPEELVVRPLLEG